MEVDKNIIINYVNRRNYKLLSKLYGFQTCKRYEPEYEVVLFKEYIQQSNILKQSRKIPKTIEDIESFQYTFSEIINFYCRPKNIEISYWEDYKDFCYTVAFISNIKAKGINEYIYNPSEVNRVLKSSPKLMDDKIFSELLSELEIDAKIQIAKSCIIGNNFKHFKMIIDSMSDIHPIDLERKCDPLYDCCYEYWNKDCLHYLFEKVSKEYKFLKRFDISLKTYYFYNFSFLKFLEDNMAIYYLLGLLDYYKIVKEKYSFFPILLIKLGRFLIKADKSINQIMYDNDDNLLGTILDVFDSTDSVGFYNSQVYSFILRYLKAEFAVNFRNIAGYMMKDFGFYSKDRNTLNYKNIEQERLKKESLKW